MFWIEDLLLCYFQVWNLNENELQWLCSHLGHTKKVHLGHYRQMSGYIERVEISKLLMIEDLQKADIYKGKSLEDISFEGKSHYFEKGLLWFWWKFNSKDSRIFISYKKCYVVMNRYIYFMFRIGICKKWQLRENSFLNFLCVCKYPWRTQYICFITLNIDC